MPITFEAQFADNALKNRTLTLEIEALKRFITPDLELLDGQDMLGYRLEREKESVTELKAMLEQKTYIKKEYTKEDIARKRAEILEQIEAHKSDIKKLEAQRIEIPKAIARLEHVMQAQRNDLCVFKVPSNVRRGEIKAVLTEIETKLNAIPTSHEKRMLTYLQERLETVKTVIDSGQQLNDTYLYLHQTELKHFAKLKTFQEAKTMVAVNMLENLVHSLETEQERLRQNRSPIYQQFTAPIERLNRTLEEVRREPRMLSDKVIMRQTVLVIDNLSQDVQREKEVSPSFKDRLRNFVNGFRNFMNNAFGVEIPEPESLKSRTLTNMYTTQQQAHQFRRMAGRLGNQDDARPNRPRLQ